ncbi:hypothetical protein BM1_07292 [Bipolaris maydis]|nr:hypothetical protein BM1_07292 [Bipolaris maydis]
MESCKKPNETEMRTPVPENGNQVLTFSTLFIVLATAMVPAMIGFAKAVQDGETGFTSDADFSIVIRDTIMTVLAAALSAVQLFRSPRKDSAYKMAWVFSGLAISLGVTAIIFASQTPDNKAGIASKRPEVERALAGSPRRYAGWLRCREENRPFPILVL